MSCSEMKTVRGKGKVRNAAYIYFPVFPETYSFFAYFGTERIYSKSKKAIKDKEKKEAQRRNTRASPHLDPPPILVAYSL
jgi:hypothetical protein